MSQLGDRLKVLRGQRGMTQQQLAVKADLSVVTVARVETGHKPGRPGGTNVSTLEKIARALDVPMSALFENGDDQAELGEAATERTEIA